VAAVLGAMALAAHAQVSLDPRGVDALSRAASVVVPKTDLRIDSNLVLVPVSVCDPDNRPVTGLEKEHFKIFDNKVEQTVTHFAMDDEPLAVGLVFDTSGSMGTKLRKSWRRRRFSKPPIPRTSSSWWSSTTRPG
jgi:Ca-activated chloride channel family protein